MRSGDLAAILTDASNDGDVLFIDLEIHRLARPVEEVLYPAMEDCKLDIVIGKGPTARSIRLDLPRFTLVGATTRTRAPHRALAGTASGSWPAWTEYYEVDDWLRRPSALRARHGHPRRGDLRRRRSAARSPLRSRGTPRIANRLLRRVRDFVEVRAQGEITDELAEAGLDLFGIDRLGLDKVDRAILEALCSRFGGQAVGLTTLSQCVGEEGDTIEDAYEPFLLQQGLVRRDLAGSGAGTTSAHRPSPIWASSRPVTVPLALAWGPVDRRSALRAA